MFRDLQNYLADFFEKVAKFCKRSQNLQIFAKFPDFAKKVLIFAKIADFLQNFAKFLKIQPDSFVDLEKPEKMSIWLLS